MATYQKSIKSLVVSFNFILFFLQWEDGVLATNTDYYKP